MKIKRNGDFIALPFRDPSNSLLAILYVSTVQSRNNFFFFLKKEKNSGVQQPHLRREFHSIPEQMSSCYRSYMENYCEEEREALASPDPAAQAQLNQWTEYDYIP